MPQASVLEHLRNLILKMRIFMHQVSFGNLAWLTFHHDHIISQSIFQLLEANSFCLRTVSLLTNVLIKFSLDAEICHISINYWS